MREDIEDREAVAIVALAQCLLFFFSFSILYPYILAFSTLYPWFSKLPYGTPEALILFRWYPYR